MLLLGAGFWAVLVAACGMLAARKGHPPAHAVSFAVLTPLLLGLAYFAWAESATEITLGGARTPPVPWAPIFFGSALAVLLLTALRAPRK